MFPLTQRERVRLAQVDALRQQPPGASTWACQFEAVDLYANLFDTEDLSVIRGASVGYDLLGRYAEETLKDAGVTGASIVTSAASSVRLVAPDEATARRAGEALVARAARPPWQRPSVFSVAPWPRGAGAPWETLGRRNILARMSGFTLARGGDLAGEMDATDRVRVADTDSRTARKKMSSVSAARYCLGRAARTGLVADLLDVHVRRHHGAPLHVKPLASLAAAEQAMTSKDARLGSPFARTLRQDLVGVGEASHLPGYIALIEADGNGFGRLFQDITSPVDFAALSLALDLALTRTLATVCAPELEHLRKHLPQQDADDDDTSDAPRTAPAQRLHLLFQAGDEWLLILPGSRGLQALAAMPGAWDAALAELQQLDDSTYADAVAAVKAAAARLAEATFSAGCLIAHANTPMQHLRDTVHALQQRAQDHSRKDADGKARSPRPWAFDWAVSKTHDVLPEDLDAARRHLHGNAARATLRPTDGDVFQAFYAWAAAIQRDPPMRALKLAERAAVDRLRGDQVDFTWSPDAVDALRAAVTTHDLTPLYNATGTPDGDLLTAFAGKTPPDGHIPPWPDLVEALDVLRYGAKARGSTEASPAAPGGQR